MDLEWDREWLVELSRPSLVAWRRIESLATKNAGTTPEAALVAATANACAQAESPFARRRMTASLALWTERFRAGRPMAFAHALAETARLECLVAGDDSEGNLARSTRAVALLDDPDLAAVDPLGHAAALARAEAHRASEHRLAGDPERAEADLARAWRRLDDTTGGTDPADGIEVDVETLAVLLVARGALTASREDLERAAHLVEQALPGRGLAAEAYWRLARLGYAAGDLVTSERSVELGLRDLPEGLDEPLRGDLEKMATLLLRLREKAGRDRERS